MRGTHTVSASLRTSNNTTPLIGVLLLAQRGLQKLDNWRHVELLREITSRDVARHLVMLDLLRMRCTGGAGQVGEPCRSFSDVPKSSIPVLDLGPGVAESRVPPVPIENNRTIQIDRFIPRAQIDARYLDTPYYVVPRDEVGQEAFAVIRDAMREKDVVGLGRVVLARRERPILVEPMGNGILWYHLAVQSRGQGGSRLLRRHSETQITRRDAARC
jgi:hypothetical protein